MECHKLGATWLEGYFAPLMEVETDFETTIGGTTDNVAQAAHYYHFHIFEDLNLKIQENASNRFQNVKDEKQRDKERKEKLRLEEKSVTLPRLNLPTFHGKSSPEWSSFIGVFSALMEKSQTKNYEKFTYLKLCLHGDSKVLADGYTEVTNQNYDKLLDQLKRRFGLKRLIARDH
jgi:hypothetical protein